MISPCGEIQAFNSEPSHCDTTIWFVNAYPGEEIYQLEGHSALRITTCDTDVAVNYGLFNFNAPNFVYRFVKGETDYMVGVIPWELFRQEYISENRRIVAHRLNLSSAEKAKLLELLEVNLRPENREYRYNYVLDNCATRPLRLVERAVGDTLLVGEPCHYPGITTFREAMRLFHANYPWYQFGIDLALGKGIDVTIDERAKTFAPIVLDDQLPGITIGHSNKNLTTQTEIINDADPFGAIQGPTPWYFSPLFISWLIAFAVSGYVLFKYIRKNTIPRFLVSMAMLINGLGGLLIAFLIFISVHEATSPNVNILWLNPLCLIPMVSVWVKKAKKFNGFCFFINFVLLTLLLLFWIFGYQSPNPAFIPLVLTDMLLSAVCVLSFRVKERKTKQ